MFEVPQAVAAFRAAIELDSAYAPAHAGLALACCAQAKLRIVPPAEAYNEARAAALRALAMDDACADAQVALGSVLFFSEWNWARSGKEPETGAPARPPAHRSIPAVRAVAGGAGPTGERAGDEAQGPGTRPVLSAGASADLDVLLEPAALRRRDRMGQQGSGTRSTAPSRARAPGRCVLEEGRFRAPSGREYQARPRRTACPMPPSSLSGKLTPPVDVPAWSGYS